MAKTLKWALSLILLGIVIVVSGLFFLLHRSTNWKHVDSPSAQLLYQNNNADIIQGQRIQHVVLISMDTTRADHLSCYGYSKKTSPNIDAVAADGVRFNHVISPVPLTFPAHSSMLTGTIPPYHKVRDNNNYSLNGSNLTLAEILKDNGFTTGAVIGAVVLDARFGLNQGFDIYDDAIEGKEDALEFEVNERFAAEVSSLGNSWLKEHRDEKTFLFLHYYDPHTPYVQRSRLTPPIPEYIYDDEITYTDHHIGQVIQTLKDLGIYDSTLLIITGDHGESLGEHSEDTHGFFIYHSTQLVPLIIRVPGGPRGVVNETVGLVDIVPTVCGLLDIEPFSMFQGKDLSGYISKKYSETDHDPRFIYCESLAPTQLNAGPFLGLISGQWKYIHTSEPELYDLSNDPKETLNLLETEKLQVGIMQHELKALIEDELYNTVAVTKNVLDDQTRQRLQSLGYVAGDTVDTNIRFEQTTTNPKDLVEIYNLWEKVLVHLGKGHYRKAKSLCYEMLDKRPDILQPYFHLGQMAIFEQDTPKVLEYFSAYLANEDHDQNLSEMPNKKNQYAQAHTNIGSVLAQGKKYTRALEHHKKALYYNPESLMATFNVGGVYLSLNNYTEAARYFERALELDPDMPEANRYLAEVRFKQGRFDEAVRCFSAVLEVQPNAAEVQSKLSLAKQELSKDVELQEKMLRIDPDQPQLHINVSVLYWQQKNLEKALYHWERVIELDPDQPQILNNLAWCKAVYPEKSFFDPDAAAQLAQKACELTGYQDATLMDTLSIAYAAQEKFDEAVKTAEKALTVALMNNQKQTAEDIQERLALFKARKSYQEKP